LLSAAICGVLGDEFQLDGILLVYLDLASDTGLEVCSITGGVAVDSEGSVVL